jgi:hypothetical protein
MGWGQVLKKVQGVGAKAQVGRNRRQVGGGGREE